MPNIKVAFSDEGNPKKIVTAKGKKKRVPPRLASGSATTIKKLVAAYPGTTWLVATYSFKPSVENLIHIITDIESMETAETYTLSVNENGRVRKAVAE